jgi:VCBS repeat-containing protein
VDSVTQGSNGTVTNNGTDVTYTPAADYCGADSFTYTASDGNGGSDTANVSITVTCVNDAPVANDDSATTNEDTPVTIDVLANDTDVEGVALTPILVTAPSHGILALNENGSYTYTPGTAYSPTDSFTYKVTDGELESNVASVTITINDLKPEISVIKTSVFPYVNQGNDVTFTVEVVNQSASSDPVTITSIYDDVYGEILGATDTDCTAVTIDSGTTYTCSFTVTAPIDLIGSQTNTIEVSVVDDENNPASDTDEAEITVLPKSQVTNSSLCIFDRISETPERDFRLLFTPDVQNYPAFKLTASNPGQFFYNVFYTGGGQTATVEVTIPYPFVTQGATPVHIYSSVLTYTNDQSETCFTPEGSEIGLQELITLESYGPSATFGDTVTLVFTDLPVDSVTGLVYLNIHLDYGLKGPDIDANHDGKADRYEKQGRLEGGVTLYDAVNFENLMEVLIEDRYMYTFSSNNDPIGDSIYNQNEFKVTPGIAGFVFEVIGGELEVYTHEDLTIRLVIPKSIKDPRDYLETIPDEDGWYMIEYKHTGKPTNYRFEVYRGEELLVEKTVRLKGNEYEEVHIYLDEDDGGGGGVGEDPSKSHYVSNMQGSSKATKKSWNAKVLVTVQDQDENLVANAMVSGFWTMDGVEKPAFCETDETGSCEVTLNKIDASIQSVSLDITDVFVDGSIYDPNASVVHEDVFQSP